MLITVEEETVYEHAKFNLFWRRRLGPSLRLARRLRLIAHQHHTVSHLVDWRCDAGWLFGGSLGLTGSGGGFASQLSSL